MNHGRTTQLIANTFPGWANIRTDEQSLGYQFLNIIGNRFDDFKRQQVNLSDNYYLPTSIVSDIDVIRYYQLPRSFIFTKEDDDNTELLYTPPTVSGFIGTGYYQLTIAEKNDIESFWYTALPTRLSVEQTVNTAHLMASGLIINSPISLTVPSGLAYIPNRLTITISGANSCIGIEDNKMVRKGLVHLTGYTREGAEVSEELVFLHNDTQQTLHDFKSLTASGVRIYGINEPETTTIYVTSAMFNLPDYPMNNQELDVNIYNEETPLFCSIGSGENYISTLDIKKYAADDLLLRINGFTEKNIILQQELLDINDSNITPYDLAVEPHSNRLWIVDSGSVYIYSSELPYPNLNVLTQKDYEARSVIDASSYYVVIGDTVELNYIWKRPNTGMIAHRVWVEKPDGTKKSLEDGVEVTYHTDSTSWIYGEPQKRQIRNTEFYTLSQRGDYIFSLEVSYTDETISIDQRVVSVLSLSALSQFSTLELGITEKVVGIDFDSEYKLWLLGQSNVKYQIDKHYDNMLIDFSRKIIYFREPYTLISVIS